MKPLAAGLLCAWASIALAQEPPRGQSQLEHVPPDPPQSHVDHDMSYRELVQMMGMDDRRRVGKVMLDRLECHDGDDGSQYAWEAGAWYGGDYHKAWLEAEGERVADSTHESRIEGGWDRIISPWWNVRAGLRHDAGEGPARATAERDPGRGAEPVPPAAGMHVRTALPVSLGRLPPG